MTDTMGPVPLGTKLVYGFGSVSEGTKNTAFNVFLLFYYNQVLGLSGTLSGSAILVALVIDAITDPLMGSISDNFHSRLGRRHPFMYAAALPMSVCFFLLFNPPDLQGMWLFGWMVAFAVGVRVSMTLYAIPSAAMLPELTTHYDERTTLVSYRFLFGWIGGLVASQLGYLYFFRAVAGVDGRLDAEAYQGFSIACALMIFTAILTCAGGTHRLIPQLRKPIDASGFTIGRFLTEFGNAARNRSYRAIVLATLFAAAAGGFNDVVGLYVNTFFWGFSAQQIGMIVFGLFFAVVLAVALTRPFTERMDKRSAALRLVAFAVLFGPSPIFLRLLDLMPPNGDPLLLYLMIGHAIIIVASIVAISITIASMVADVIDENELETGQRQEGMFSAAIAFAMKATSGLGGFVAGVALDVIDFPRGAAPADVPADKIYLLGLAVGPGLMLLFLLTLVFLTGYRITRERHGEILQALGRRPGAPPPPPVL